MCECQIVAGQEIARDVLLIDFWREFIGHQHHHHVAVECSFGGVLNYKAGGFRFFARGAVSSEADDHIAARVFQVVGVGVPLRSVADHCYLLALETAEIRVLVVVNVHYFSYP